MVIQHNKWKAVAVKNSEESDYKLGYEAPATQDTLQWLKKNGISIVQLIDGKKFQDMPKLVRPDNPDKHHFISGQKFRIIETNTSFKSFEKALWDEYPSEKRFDDLITYTDPNAWGKTDTGYCLRVSPLLSDDKKAELKESLVGLSSTLKSLIHLGSKHTDKIFVSGKNAQALEFIWEKTEKHASPIILDFDTQKQADSSNHKLNQSTLKKIGQKRTSEY